VRALQEQLDAQRTGTGSADIAELTAKLERQAEAMQQVSAALAAERSVAKAAARKHTASLIMCRAALRAAHNKAATVTAQLQAQQSAAAEAIAESSGTCQMTMSTESSKETCDAARPQQDEPRVTSITACLITQFKAARYQAQKAWQERREQIQQVEAVER
jgi:hypothetical protein